MTEIEKAEGVLKALPFLFLGILSPKQLSKSGCQLSHTCWCGGSGTSVNANTQIGKENNQSVFDQSRDISGENVNVNQSQGAFSVDGDAGNVKVLNQDIPMWMILLAVLGWMLPSPIEIWRGFLKTITLGRYRG